MPVKHSILKKLSSHNHLIILRLIDKCSTYKSLTFRLHDLVLKNPMQNVLKREKTRIGHNLLLFKTHKTVFHKLVLTHFVCNPKTNKLALT